MGVGMAAAILYTDLLAFLWHCDSLQGGAESYVTAAVIPTGTHTHTAGYGGRELRTFNWTIVQKCLLCNMAASCPTLLPGLQCLPSTMFKSFHTCFYTNNCLVMIIYGLGWGSLYINKWSPSWADKYKVYWRFCLHGLNSAGIKCLNPQCTFFILRSGPDPSQHVPNCSDQPCSGQPTCPGCHGTCRHTHRQHCYTGRPGSGGCDPWAVTLEGPWKVEKALNGHRFVYPTVFQGTMLCTVSNIFLNVHQQKKKWCINALCLLCKDTAFVDVLFPHLASCFFSSVTMSI